MADEIDQANAVADEMLSRAIAYAAAKTRDAEPTGFCLNCNEPLKHPHRWCDKDCMDDYTTRIRK